MGLLLSAGPKVAMLQRNPEAWPAHNNLGNVLFQKEQVDEAIIECQKAIEIYPNHAKAHNNLGTALLKNRRLPEAIAQFQEAVRLDPTNTSAQNNLRIAQAMAKQRANQK